MCILPATWARDEYEQSRWRLNVPNGVDNEDPSHRLNLPKESYFPAITILRCAQVIQSHVNRANLCARQIPRTSM